MFTNSHLSFYLPTCIHGTVSAFLLYWITVLCSCVLINHSTYVINPALLLTQETCVSNSPLLCIDFPLSTGSSLSAYRWVAISSKWKTYKTKPLLIQVCLTLAACISSFLYKKLFENCEYLPKLSLTFSNPFQKWLWLRSSMTSVLSNLVINSKFLYYLI